ncbi:hypothetical protein [Mesorhizobium sp.]|uniref:hypothetical protein n=1 Tax=Mesorhizobium sp. TaxID=1871066 RepID=UPI0025BC1D76|nr:hypothetical protein [Mesorhizobium sp.]
MYTTNAAAPLDRNFGQRLDQVVDRAVDEGRIVGAVVLVASRAGSPATPKIDQQSG